MVQSISQKEKGWKVKSVRLIFLILIIFAVSGISSVLTDKYIFPWLAATKWIGKSSFFKHAMDNVTVINKTEQVNVTESQNISSYTQRSASSVVEVVKRQKGNNSAIAVDSRSASGVIVTSDGLVASYGEKFFSDKDAEFSVFTQEGKSYAADVAGIDPYSDIALLKLENAENLPVAEFIAPEDIKTGVKIALISRSGFDAEIALRLAVASEWAKDFSLSGPLASSEKLQGVLFSGLNLENIQSEPLDGGVAVDQNGNVIGILGQRKSDADTQLFIIPVNHLQHVINQYIEKGKIERATLGVYYLMLSEESGYVSGDNFTHGALVYSPSGQQGLAVIAGGAADQAGIKMGDVILSVNGDEINPGQNLAYLISKYKPGDTVNLHIMRDGKEIDVGVALQ